MLNWILHFRIGIALFEAVAKVTTRLYSGLKKAQVYAIYLLRKKPVSLSTKYIYLKE